MLLIELRAQKGAVAALGNQYGARRIRVSGSVARGEDRPESDVDFHVDFLRGYDLFTQRLPLADRLADSHHRHVELVPEHEPNALHTLGAISRIRRIQARGDLTQDEVLYDAG